MKLLSELVVEVGYSEKDIFSAINKKYRVLPNEIEKYELLKESLDARKKPNVVIKLNIAVEVKKQALHKLKNCDDILVNKQGVNFDEVQFKSKRPIVVGFGPAGMFAGLAFAMAGLKPIILEQGKKVDERQKDIDEFWKNRKLNKFSNVQFGEGGAGTYSDGKLASNVSNNYTKICINELILNGAPKDIFYSYAPHIGSDLLKGVVTNIRKKIEKYCGEVLFNTHFDGYDTKNGRLNRVFATNVETGKKMEFETDSVVLAVGHSAVDTYKFLKENNCELKQKPFAMGVRIEQNQEAINIAQYGSNDNKFPAANYKLAVHLDSGRSVFTFCMCPGGYVVASSSEDGTIVTNGMSNHARDGKNANSALLVNIEPSDFENKDVLSGVEFQHKYEKLAFELGGRDYSAPAEKVGDFLNKKTEGFDSNQTKIKSTFLPNIKFADLSKSLPNFVTESLREALPLFEKKIKGFADKDNLLIGIESRSSAPVQIVRGENLMTNIPGIFAAGEGAGYAGGITSSAADGLKIAEKVIEYLAKLKK